MQKTQSRWQPVSTMSRLRLRSRREPAAICAAPGVAGGGPRGVEDLAEPSPISTFVGSMGTTTASTVPAVWLAAALMSASTALIATRDRVRSATA